MVSYNRRPLVLEALAAIRAQTRAADSVILVDNASTDATADAVRAEFGNTHDGSAGVGDIDVVGLTRNTGGAGGFALGMALALDRGADLVWLLDDDAIPEPGALAALLAARAQAIGAPPALMASRVVWTDGRAHPMNTPRRRPLVSRAEAQNASAIGCLPIRSASFVSVLVDAGATRRLGLPMADYFLWNDDFEFTTRLLRHGVGLLCPTSVVVHKTKVFGSSAADPGERFYYEVRNKIWTLSSPGILSPRERLLYTGATLRRWFQTFMHSRDRATLRRALGRGLRAGLSARPRPTADVLAEIGYPDTY